MPPLDRAVTLTEMDDSAVSVGEDLHFDVARVLEVALDVDRRVGEVRLPLAAGGLVRPLDLVGAVSDPEALSPAAGGSLDRDRISDLGGRPREPRPGSRPAASSPG